MMSSDRIPAATIERAFQMLADRLSAGFCDGCSIEIAGGVTCYGGDAGNERLPVSVRAVLPVSAGLIQGTVIVTRHGDIAFSKADLVAIATCIEYASLSVASAMQLDDERATLRIEREHTAQFQRELLGVISHDLRAPLGGILLGIEMLVQSQTAAPAAHAIGSFAKRMVRMIDQVFDLTRMRLSGDIPLARCRTTLLPLIRSSIHELAVAHPDMQIDLVCAPDVRGEWDMDRLGQVFATVLTNAAQYGRPGALIRINVAHVDGTTQISFHNEVRDLAISAASLACMFEPFQRNDDEHPGTGLGLGLYLADAIVRGHGGRMTMQSSLSGTIVEVALPDVNMGGPDVR